MAEIVIAGNTSGSVTLVAPSIAGTTTLTLPASSGTVLDDASVGVCRAWVNFNGTGTVAIRAAFNVSSITDNGTGNYTTNFTNAMPDANYSVCIAASISSIINTGYHIGSSDKLATFSTTSVKVYSKATSATTYYDADYMCVSIFR